MFDDPELEALRKATKAFSEQIAATLADHPDFHEMTVEQAREGIPGVPPAPVLYHGITRSIPGPHGEIELRLFVPEDPKGVYLHFHGGGWVIGSAMGADPKLDDIASSTRSVVASVEYRLAPEHPYPVPSDDCEAAALWVLEHSDAEWGVSEVVVGGESAGGHLTAQTALRLRDRHDALDAVRGLNLVFGAFDLSMTPSQRQGSDGLLIPTPTMEWFYDLFLQNGENRTDPDVSPLYADLEGMPPALFTVGTADPLLDDSLFMAARYAAAGNDATLHVYPEAIHGFTGFPDEMSKVANERAKAFIAESWT